MYSHDPGYASVGERRDRAAEYAPSSAATLRQFAYAAARRYSGTFLDTASGRILPRVERWLAWNEPNSPVFLLPQFERVGGKCRTAAPAAYAKICNAIYAGVHAAGGPERVGCGVTGAAWPQRPDGPAALDLAAHVPAGGQASGSPRLRCLGAPPVLRRPVGDPRQRATSARALSDSATSMS